MADLLLRLDSISKRYGATLALDNVRFDLRAGEVHALMGENGAGKSTLMKILAGNIEGDAGQILLDGSEVTIRSPDDARRHGIAIIHQELNTVPEMTVAENLALGREPKTRLGLLDRKRMLADATAKLARIHAPIDPQQKLGALSVGLQQMVEIARALAFDAQIIILDEPTSSLSEQEGTLLLNLILKLKSDGVTEDFKIPTYATYALRLGYKF